VGACQVERDHRNGVDQDGDIENSRKEDLDGGSVNSNAAEAVPAIGNIYTNDANDNSMEMANSPPPREEYILNIRRRSHSCSSITSTEVETAPDDWIINTNCAIDNPMEICTSPAST
jgi:hypothetical protein